MNSRKKEQLTNSIKILLADILSREISDPRLDDIVISRIELASDGSFAKVYVSTYLDDDGTGPEKAKVLKKASGYIRKLLGRKLKVRIVPELRFVWDDSVKDGEHVLSILRTITSEED